MPPGLAKLGLTPAKTALVVVLGVVLCAIWLPQLAALVKGPPRAARPPSRPAPAAIATSATSRIRSPQRAPQTPKTIAKPPAPQAAQSYELADATGFDPFGVPAWSPDHPSRLAAEVDGETSRGPEALSSTLTQLQSQGVGMVLMSGDEATATVGERTLRVGDVIDGFRVIDISATGVTLTPATEGDRGV